MVEVPIIVNRLDGKEDVLKVFTYLVDADVPFLCGKKTIEKWNSKIDTKNKVLETEIEGEKKNFRIIETGGNHVAIEIEKKQLREKEIFLAVGEDKPLQTNKAIRKVHEVTNHKSVEQLITIYRNAGLIEPGTINMIKNVVNECKYVKNLENQWLNQKLHYQEQDHSMK